MGKPTPPNNLLRGMRRSSMKAVILSARRASCNLPVEIWEVVFSFLHYKDYRALGKVMSDHSERETQAMGPAFATE